MVELILYGGELLGAAPVAGSSSLSSFVRLPAPANVRRWQINKQPVNTLSAGETRIVVRAVDQKSEATVVIPGRRGLQLKSRGWKKLKVEGHHTWRAYRLLVSRPRSAILG